MDYRAVIENDSHMLKEVSSGVVEKLSAYTSDEKIAFNVKVALEEAMRNAMVHGNRFDPLKKVTVEAQISETAVKITVEDEGEGFDPESVPDPTSEENILKAGGRGVYLMGHLMDDVKYEDDGRRVVMVKYFSNNTI